MVARGRAVERIKAALDDQEVWDSYAEDDQARPSAALTELLTAVQPPGRWMKPGVAVRFRRTGRPRRRRYVEVGLGNAPALASLGAKTLRLPQFAGRATVYNVGRDEAAST